MPAKREYTAAELRARLDHEREQSRIRQARWRARHGKGNGDDFAPAGVTVTRAPENGVLPVPPGPPVVSSSLKKERAARTTLRAFADRGYVDDPKFWSVVATKYPDLDLELEALKISDWLTEPRNLKRRCSRSFLDSWLGRAHASTNRAADPVGIASPRPMVITNGAPYHQPITQQGRNPGPPDLPHFEGPVQRIDDGELARFIAARRDTPFAEKLARKTNGRH